MTASPTSGLYPAPPAAPHHAGPVHRISRLRAYAEFMLAVIYFLLAWKVAQRITGLTIQDAFVPLVNRALLAVLLVLGYAVLGFVLDRQYSPIAAQGWPLRSGWLREAGLGLATGWGLAVACVIPLAVFGGIAIRLITGSAAWGWLLADLAFFALAALVEEVAYRGYGFQRFAQALGGMSAALCFSIFYAIIGILQQGWTTASVSVSFVFGILLSTAYLRTRALWLSWGINFAWKASRAVLFGLAIAGDNSHSPIVQGDPMGPFWVTGGGFGQEGSWLTFIILAAALPVVYSLTRDLDFKHNAPVIISGGIAVDLDDAARRQHEAAMGSAEPAPTALVQIQPVASAPALDDAPVAPEIAPANPPAGEHNF